MTLLLPTHRHVIGFALFLLAASPVGAQQQAKPAGPAGDAKTHRLEIYNGPLRSTAYYADGMSLGERTSLNDLQRLENEMSYTDNLAHLRAQYVRDERDLQRRRTIVQNLLYGNATSYGSGFYPGSIYGGYGYRYGYGLPLGYAYPGVATSAFYPGYVGSAGTTTQSLAFGMGDEGVVKNEIAHVLAAQSSPTYAMQVRQEYVTALDRASSNPRLAAALGLKKGDIVLAEHERLVAPGLGLSPGDQVSMTLKEGKAVDGKFVRENDDWVTVSTANEQVTMRKSEIVRFARKQ